MLSSVQMSVQTPVQLVVMHMGALHAYEKVLTLILAFGPFLLLAAVIVHRRRQDAAAEGDAGGDAAGATDEIAADGPAQAQRER